MQIRVLSRYPKITTSCPGVVESVATAQDPTCPGGAGVISLDYAATPSSKLAFTAPGSTIGAYSADLDTGDPVGTVLTDGQSHFIAVDTTSATLAAVHVDTDYGVTIVPSGTCLWAENDIESMGASIERAVKAGACLDRADLSGLDLSGRDLRGIKAVRASFRGTNFCGALLTTGDCSYADFTGANLAGATTTSLTLTGATLTGSDELAEVVGGLTVGTVAPSTSGSVAETTSTERVTTGSGAAVVRTVPTAVGCAGRRIAFVKMDAGTTAGQIASTSAQTFGGAASPLSLDTRYHGWMIESDGANWQCCHLSIYKPLAASEKAAASGVASLSAGSLVVQDPANAQATKGNDKIVKADATGGIDVWGYTPTTTGDWTGADPTTIREALDRIAAAMTIHLISP
jgi:uncharacterized protein YjbI with pentapeptide repeats